MREMSRSLLATQDQVVLTKERLWFLYCFCGFSKAEIEDMTGWTRARLDYGLRKWRLTMMSETSLLTRHWLETKLADMLRIKMTLDNMERLSLASHALREKIREHVSAHRVDWNAIDRLPWLAEVMRLVDTP